MSIKHLREIPTYYISKTTQDSPIILVLSASNIFTKFNLCAKKIQNCTHPILAQFGDSFVNIRQVTLAVLLVFIPRVSTSMLTRYIDIGTMSVRPSIRPSVTLRYCVKTA